ncbi:MAG: NAD(P)H-dependent oxidoreductase [Candidatus Omnitrophota bacterium]
MQYLVIYAHPNPKSFNHAVKEQIETVLKSQKKEFWIRDLYSLNFNPALSAADLTQLAQGAVPQDIQTEQDFVRKADTLIFVHPVWWFGMPAVLKGYIDRVFSYGFAYRVTKKGLEGLLSDKKVMIFNTTGGMEEDYQKQGYIEGIKTTVERGIFEFCGMKVILHKYFYAVPSVDAKAREAMLAEIKNIQFAS